MAHGPAKGVRCPQSSGTCGRRAWRGAAARSLNPGFRVSWARARRTNRNRKDGRFPARRLRLGAVGAGGSPGSSGGPVRPTPDGSPVRHGAAHRHSGGGSAAHEHPTRAPREDTRASGAGRRRPTVGPAGTDAGRGRKGGRGTRPPDPGSRGEHERRSLRPLPGRTRCHTAAAAPDALLGGRDRAWVSPAWTERGSVHQQHL